MDMHRTSGKVALYQCSRAGLLGFVGHDRQLALNIEDWSMQWGTAEYAELCPTA